MPVSHVRLTVSHLPTSTSFFLSALQPLGYCFLGQRGDQASFGVHEADFFLVQQNRSRAASVAHIAFSAPSRSAVKSFYTSALIAGASPHGPPAYRSDGVERYSAAVLDLDGNSIEVVYHPEPTADDSTVVTGQSKVLRWNRHAVQDLGLEKVVGSDADYSGVATAAALAARKALMPAGYASSSLSQSQSGQEQTNAVSSSVVGSTLAPSLNRSLTDPIIKALTSGEDKVEMSSKTLVGTILGAAAGAAMAYAMCKSEEDSAKAELEHSRQLVTASTSRQNPTAPPAQAASEQPPPYGISNAEEYFPAAPSVKEYYSAAPSVKGRTEPPPRSERSETDYPRSAYHTAVSARTRADTEYYSVGSRSNASLQRSQTYPEPPRKRKGASRVSSSTLEPQPEESQQGSSYQSYHSSKTHRSKTSSSAKSSSTIKGDARETSDSRSRTSRSTRSKGESRSREGSASPTSGRQSASRGAWEPLEEVSGAESDEVFPSDSISQVGDEPRRRPSARSRASTTSTRKSSHHSSARKSSAPSATSQRRNSYVGGETPVIRPDEIYEPADERRGASTVTPHMYKHKERRGRDGTVVSLPVRGFAPSTAWSSDGRRIVSHYG